MTVNSGLEEMFWNSSICLPFSIKWRRNFDQKYKFMVSAWSNFKNISSRPLFTTRGFLNVLFGIHCVVKQNIWEALYETSRLWMTKITRLSQQRCQCDNIWDYICCIMLICKSYLRFTTQKALTCSVQLYNGRSQKIGGWPCFNQTGFSNKESRRPV